jgi:CRISPR-associated protein Csc1
MRVCLCRLTFHENLFYATREMGRLYETGRYLHNYALTYALGLAVAPYFHRRQIPHYEEELTPLNDNGIYVTPARGVDVRYELVTFKHADPAYHQQMVAKRHNIPSYGRAKEIAVGSRFEFAVASREPMSLPCWVRMGLWQSKARLECLVQAEGRMTDPTERTSSLPLNPLDVAGDLKVYDLISMPPSSLVENARIYTEWLQAEIDGRTLSLPAHMGYTFPET